MGLDAVELILRAEEEFNITIEDSEAERVRTVGDFYQLILTKLDLTPDCQTSKAFFQTRRALVETLDIPKRSIRPTTELEPLFPIEQRRYLWGGLAHSIALELPQLKHTRAWRSRFITAALVLATVIVLACWLIVFRLWGVGGGIISFLAAFVGWVVLIGVTDTSLIRWTPFLRDEIPVSNAGELARVVMGMNPSCFRSSPENGKRFSKDYVWTKLVEIFCDQLQVKPDEVVPGASIAEDLGVD
jgi:acyl carrier protein/energy-converting hydrogenase Eha subunit A